VHAFLHGKGKVVAN